MKHVFYVVYILFYTGAVFVAGMFVGQMLERAWAVREKAARSASSTSSGLLSETPVQSQSSIPLTEHKIAVSGKR
jgi:NADH:ubiquinone oxidoreductase subunit 6 (subunit J)